MPMLQVKPANKKPEKKSSVLGSKVTHSGKLGTSSSSTKVRKILSISAGKTPFLVFS